MTRGQFIRLFLSLDSSHSTPVVIAAAKTLTLHVSTAVEDVSHKDVTGDWVLNEPTSTSYDIQTGALVLTDDDPLLNSGSTLIAKGLDQFEDFDDISLLWEICNVSGANNRTKGTKICGGNCKVTNVSINAVNKQNASYNATLNGYGELSLS